MSVTYNRNLYNTNINFSQYIKYFFHNNFYIQSTIILFIKNSLAV